MLPWCALTVAVHAPLCALDQFTLVQLRRVNCMHALLHAGGACDPRLSRGAGYQGTVWAPSA